MSGIESVTTIIVASFSSGTVAAVVSAIVNKRAKCKEADQSLTMGVRLLLQDKIEYLGTSYIQCGSIPYSKKEFLRIAHKCFKGLGGGEELDSIMSDVNELDVEYPEVKIHRKQGDKT